MPPIGPGNPSRGVGRASKAPGAEILKGEVANGHGRGGPDKPLFCVWDAPAAQEKTSIWRVARLRAAQGKTSFWRVVRLRAAQRKLVARLSAHCRAQRTAKTSTGRAARLQPARCPARR